jgi:hypothetical protein
VEEVGEQLDAVDESRSGTREGRGGVGGENVAGAEGADALGNWLACSRAPSR